MLSHTGERPFQCELCPLKFGIENDLRHHKKIRHFQVPYITCPHCDKVFGTANNLKSHIGIHTGEKPFKCDICDAAYVASSALAVHRRSHKNRDHCDICNLSLESKRKFQNHMQVVHGVTPDGFKVVDGKVIEVFA